MIFASCKNQGVILVHAHCVADFKIAVRPFIGQICNDDVRLFNERDNLALEQTSLIVLVNAPWVKTTSLHGRHYGLLAHLIKFRITDLHNDERLAYGNPPLVFQFELGKHLRQRKEHTNSSSDYQT